MFLKEILEILSKKGKCIFILPFCYIWLIIIKMKNLLIVLLFSILATCSAVSIFVIIKENKPLLLLGLSVFAFILSFSNVIIMGVRSDNDN